MNRARLATLIRDRFLLVKLATAILWLTWLISIASSGFRRDIKGDPIGTDHVAPSRATAFLEVFASDEDQVRETLDTLPFNPFFDVDIYPIAAPAEPESAPPEQT